ERPAGGVRREERDPVRFGKLLERACLLQRMTLAGDDHEVVAEQRAKRQPGIELDDGPPADREVERLVPHKRKQQLGKAFGDVNPGLRELLLEAGDSLWHQYGRGR